MEKLKVFMSFRYIRILLIFVIGFVFVFFTVNYVKDYYDKLPRLVKDYKGISLGMSKGEVKYSFGYPSSVYVDDGEAIKLQDGTVINGSLKVIDVEALPKSKKIIDDYFYWFYPANEINVNQAITVEFDEKTSKVISIQCQVVDKGVIFVATESCLVNGVTVYDSEEDVLKQLGSPSESEIKGVAKVLTFKKFNMKVFLVKKRVYMMEVKELH